jgi:hypothetical protein
MKELNDEIIIFPSAFRKIKKDEDLDDIPKTSFGDVLASVKPENPEDLSADELENAFDRYGIPLRVERAKKHFEKNKKGKGRL